MSATGSSSRSRDILPRLMQKCPDPEYDPSVLNSNLWTPPTPVLISAALLEACGYTTDAVLVQLQSFDMYVLTATINGTEIALEALIEMGLRIHAKNPDFKLQEGVTGVAQRLRTATTVQYNFVFADTLFLFEICTLQGPAITLCFHSDN